MKFYHQGSKKSNEPGVFSGCLLLIGLGAIIFLISLLESLEDVKEYWWQIVLAFFMGGSLLTSMFSKRGKISNKHIEIKNGFLIIEKVTISLDEIIIDLYKTTKGFRRYHVRDKKGKIAVFSILKDDLIDHFVTHLKDQVFEFNEISSKHDGPYISVFAEDRKLYYDLERGKYTIIEKDDKEISFIPEVYTYDGKYKLGKPLGRKFSKQ